MTALDDVRLGMRFARALPKLLRNRVSAPEAHRVVQARLARRPDDFLALARGAIYAHPGSPYRDLLRLAGCEYGDLERLVRQEGLEVALAALSRNGVYLTVDEFKGRRPVIRSGLDRTIAPAALANPLAAGHIPAHSGGSRSPGTPIVLDLGFVRDCVPSTLLAFEARRGIDWIKAQWQVPGSGVIARLLEYASFAPPPVRWFSHVDPGSPSLHGRYRWSVRALRWGGACLGTRFPEPEHVAVEDPLPIARWMAEIIRSGRTPHLHTFVSSAVRLCRAAAVAGIDLRTAEFMVTGEPLTTVQRAAITAVGAGVMARYGAVESGAIGFGCLAAAAADEVHVVADLHAVIQAGDGHPGLPGARGLLLTSLRPSAPLVLLNVSLGDEAILHRRSCSCPLDRLGWTQHLHTIRSHEKLTAGGMTFLDTDVIRILEETLPGRFGGGPTDYQLVEDRAANGHPRVRLLVHPRVGPVDGHALGEALLSALAGDSGAGRVMELAWRAAGFVQVERRAPLTSGSGKILHIHSSPDTASARAPARTAPVPGSAR